MCYTFSQQNVCYKSNYRTLDQQNQSAMILKIRERYQKVLQCWQETTCRSLRAIAQATGQKLVCGSEWPSQDSNSTQNHINHS